MADINIESLNKDRIKLVDEIKQEQTMVDCVSLPNAAELVERLRDDARDLSRGANGKVECNLYWKAADAIEALMQENAKLKAERDAAVADLKDLVIGFNRCICDCCKHMKDGRCRLPGCRWEWRGAQKEEEDGKVH